MKKKLNKTIKIIIIILSITLITLVYLSNQNKDHSYFKSFHFDYWELKYPDIKASNIFREKLSFSSDRTDYIVFPFHVDIKKEIDDFLNDNASLIFASGNNKLKHYILNVTNDDGILEKK